MNRIKKRIAIIGPESTGKTTLARDLAAYFKTEWVPEYARQYLNELGREYVREDLKSIAEGQLMLERQQEEKSGSLLICDTNLIVIKVWSEHKYGKIDRWIAEQAEKRKYHFYFLTACDVPWEHDDLRENPDDREEIFARYKSFLEKNDLPYQILEGSHKERMKKSIEIINDL